MDYIYVGAHALNGSRYRDALNSALDLLHSAQASALDVYIAYIVARLNDDPSAHYTNAVPRSPSADPIQFSPVEDPSGFRVFEILPKPQSNL